MTGAVASGVVDQVRERLARSPGELTPHRVAEALRESGQPVGDATVLAVHEALRRDVVGAGPLEPLLRMAGVTAEMVRSPGEYHVMFVNGRPDRRIDRLERIIDWFGRYL